MIDKNKQRTRKNLFTQRSGGTAISVYEAYNQDDEAQYVVDTIRQLIKKEQFKLSDFAVFYRTNAQSRAIEDTFVRMGVPYRLVGGLRFYSRREIKDVLAYLRLVHNPHDAVSLARVINVPARGIGAKSIETLDEVARQSGRTLYQLVSDLAHSDTPLPGVSTKARQSLLAFAQLIDRWIDSPQRARSVAELMDLVLRDSGYFKYVNDGTDEGRDRWDNIKELRNVASDYTEALGDDPLAHFLEDVALVADVDSLKDQVDAPVLMTLHAAKGLEFPVVFITGHGRRSAAAFALAGRSRRDGRGAPPVLRGHHARQRSRVPVVCLPPHHVGQQRCGDALAFLERYSHAVGEWSGIVCGCDAQGSDGGSRLDVGDARGGQAQPIGPGPRLHAS